MCGTVGDVPRLPENTNVAGALLRVTGAEGESLAGVAVFSERQQQFAEEDRAIQADSLATVSWCVGDLGASPWHGGVAVCTGAGAATSGAAAHNAKHGEMPVSNRSAAHAETIIRASACRP